MKTTITLLALASLAVAVQASALQTKKSVPAQQAAAKAANLKANPQTTVQSSNSVEQTQGQAQCRTKTGKPVHCN